MSSPIVLVTGATGFLGLSVVSELSRRNIPFICTHRKSSNLTELQQIITSSNGQGSLCYCDFNDPATVYKAVANVKFDTIIHLAAVSAWGELATADSYDSTFRYTEILIEALRKAGKQVNLVYASSAAAAPAQRHLHSAPEDSTLNYAAAKRDAERFLLKQFDVIRRLIILRFGELYGANDHRMVTACNILEYLNKSVSFVTPGGMSILHRDDAAVTLANAISMGKSGSVYFVGGDNLTITELVREISKAQQKGTLCIHLPGAFVRPLIKVGKVLHLTNYPISLAEYTCTYWFGDNTAAVQELNHKYRSARETIQDVVQWLMADS